MNLLNDFLPRVDFKDYDDFLSNFKLNVPHDFNFGYNVVDKYAKLEPTKRALVWCNDRGDEKVFTFGDLKRLSDKAANVFIKYGIKKGDFVMLILNRRYEYWYLSIALNKIGAVFIPATHLLTKKDVIYRCDMADIKMIVCCDEKNILETVKIAKPECKTLEHIACINEQDDFIDMSKEVELASDVLNAPYKPNAEDMFLVYFTSGTTGYPKMVAHRQSYPLGHIITAHYWHNLGNNDLHFTLADTGWGKASWGKIYGQWICGAATFAYDFQGRFSPLDVLPLISKYGITSFCAPPTVYRFFIKEDVSQFDLSSLKYLTTAGEALNPEVYKQIKDKMGLEIFEAYGQTETTLLLGTFKYCTAKPGAMGLRSPLFDSFIADADGNEVPMGSEGEICIRLNKTNTGLFSFYYKDKERTSEAMRNGLYHTGDLAYVDEENYIWFVGRKDDIIKSSGYRIGPFEVESSLLEHPSVAEVAITGVPHPERGQVVKATIVLAKNYTPSEELKKELQDYVKKNTAPYKYPRIIEFVNQLPKTISGKIRRVEIRKNDESKK